MKYLIAEGSLVFTPIAITLQCDTKEELLHLVRALERGLIHISDSEKPVYMCALNALRERWENS